MTDKEKMTACNISVGADNKQSKSNKPKNIITENIAGRNTPNINIFKEVKSRVSMTEVAQFYGIKVRCDGFTNCIFHNDRHPSMKLYKDHYHCFSCQAHGDVIAFTAQLYGLAPIEAACKLAGDLGIEVGSVTTSGSHKVHKPYITENEAYILLRDYVSILKIYCELYCPGSPHEEFHPLYVQALQELPIYESYLDIFTTETKEEQKDFLLNGRGIFDELRAKLRTAKLAA